GFACVASSNFLLKREFFSSFFFFVVVIMGLFRGIGAPVLVVFRARKNVFCTHKKKKKKIFLHCYTSVAIYRDWRTPSTEHLLLYKPLSRKNKLILKVFTCVR
ncbi:unnamed protein product, partial [Ixodes pacificus]